MTATSCVDELTVTWSCVPLIEAWTPEAKLEPLIVTVVAELEAVIVEGLTALAVAHCGCWGGVTVILSGFDWQGGPRKICMVPAEANAAAGSVAPPWFGFAIVVGTGDGLDEPENVKNICSFCCKFPPVKLIWVAPLPCGTLFGVTVASVEHWPHSPTAVRNKPVISFRKAFSLARRFGHLLIG